MSLLDDPDETVGPDLEIVCQLTDAMTEAIADAIIPGVTTQADVLSAMFTMLSRVLEAAREQQEPSHAKRNAEEIGRVLGKLLLEYGAETLQ